MPATPNIIVGNVVSVTADGQTLYATKGNVTRKVKVIEVTNARSGGARQIKPGNFEASGSCDCVYNGDDPPTLTLGKEVTVNWNATAGPARPFTALITSVKDDFAADGEYSWSFDWESSGAFTSKTG